MIQYIDTGRVRATNSRRKILRIRIGSYPLTACWKWNGGIPLSRMIYHCNAWPTNTVMVPGERTSTYAMH